MLRPRTGALHCRFVSRGLRLKRMSNSIKRNCPVCGANEASPWLEKREVSLVRCARCSMIYANPVSEDFATGEYYNRDAAEYYLSPAKLDSDYSGVRFERELRLF